MCSASKIPGHAGIDLCHATSYSDAKMLCEGAGARLCKYEEVDANLLSDASDSGCGFDDSRIWTSTSCETTSCREARLCLDPGRIDIENIDASANAVSRLRLNLSDVVLILSDTHIQRLAAHFLCNGDYR